MAVGRTVAQSPVMQDNCIDGPELKVWTREVAHAAIDWPSVPLVAEVDPINVFLLASCPITLI